jgi:ubiquinol-cytochrome c reductase cytochrome c subunit
MMTHMMIKRLRAISLLLMPLAAAGLAMAGFWAGGAAAQDSAAAPSVERGKELFYVQGCYQCHGFNGETGVQDLVGTGSPIVQNVDLFLTFLRLRADQAPLLPSTRMPNYPENALSDAEARDIFAYINTLELDAPDVDAVPTLKAILESAERPYTP